MLVRSALSSACAVTVVARAVLLVVYPGAVRVRVRVVSDRSVTHAWLSRVVGECRMT